jgi:hypothetical protein
MTRKFRCFGGPLDGQRVDHPEFCEYMSYPDASGKLDEKAYQLVSLCILETRGRALVFVKALDNPGATVSEYAVQVARRMLCLSENG